MARGLEPADPCSRPSGIGKGPQSRHQFHHFSPIWSHAFFLRQDSEDFTDDSASPVVRLYRCLKCSRAVLRQAGFSGCLVPLAVGNGSQIHLIGTDFLKRLRDL